MSQENPYLSPQAPETTDASPIPPAEKQWAMFAHLAAFSGLLVPLGSILGPLIMYLMKKDDYPFGSAQARESLNFNISCAIYGIASAILCFVIIGFILLPAVFIFWIVFTILAALKANDGIAYRYPLTIRLIN